MIDDLTDSVARTTGLAPAQARLAVEGVLRVLAARLPSPLFGELQARLQEQDAGAHAAPGSATPATPADPTRPTVPPTRPARS